MTVSDEDLCQRVAKGDESAFELLVERHEKRAWRLAWSIVKDSDEARDLSQEAFIRLYQAAASFDARGRFSTWFYRIVVNLCLDYHRKHRGWRKLLLWTNPRGAGSKDEPEGPDVSQIPSPQPGPEEEVRTKQAMGLLWRAVDDLPNRQRTALLLSIQEGLSSAEIAQVLKCSETTARVHLHRALSRLKKTVSTG